MNLLGVGARTTKAQTTPSIGSTMRIQRSVNGAAVPVVYGTTRLPGNLIWYGDFKATPVPTGGKSGGKGGLTGSSAKGQAGKATFQASFAVGLCSGAIQGIGRVWDTTGAAGALHSVGGSVTLLPGAAAQAPWTYLASAHVDQALGYSGLAYIGIANMPLGESPSLPNLSFEVIGFGPATTTTTAEVAAFGAGGPFVYAPPSYPTAPFAAVSAVVKSPTSRTNVVFDTSPAFCIADLLTNTTYGAGLAPGLVGDLTAYATWCQAAGLAMSAALTEARDCRSILRDWLDATLADAFWSQGQIKIASYADTIVTGAAADGSAVTYTPNLAPVMDIDDSVMMAASSDSGPLTVTRKDPAEITNRITIEYSDRDSDYNTVTVTSDDAAHIAAYGLRPAPNMQADFITVGAVASRIADLRLARETGVLATYEWRMRSPGELLEPFDIVAVSDAALGLIDYPVRVTEVEEEDDTVFRIAAEDIPGVMSAMMDRPLSTNAAATSGANDDPGPVNAPIIFEPPSPLTLAGSGLEVWVLLSGIDLDNWGGADVWVSNDQQSYAFASTMRGAARMGTLTASLPSVPLAASGPTYDTSSTFSITLVESGGTLQSTTQQSALALNSLLYVDGELIAYTTATLTGPNTYSLTGLVRGALGSAIGPHAAGTQIGRLDGAQFRYPFTPDRIGQIVYFKFLPFNVFGGGEYSLDEVEPYTYTIQGTALTEAPNNVTGLADVYISGLSQLTWNPVADSRDLDYEIRLGSTWADGFVVGRTPVLQAPILGDGSYWVAAHYKVPNGPDVYSPTPANLAIAGSALTSNVIARHSQFSGGWAGTFANTAIAGGFLTLIGGGNILASADIRGIADVRYFGGSVASGSYQIPAGDIINVRRVAACNVMITLGAVVGYDSSAVDLRTVTDVRMLTDVLGIELGNKVTAIPQIQLSQDGVTWGAWQNWVPGAYSAMLFNARVLLFTSDPSISAVLTDFVFAVDVPDRVDQFTNITIAPAGHIFTFATQFNGGPGGAGVPNLQITIHGAQQGDQIVTSNRSLSGFTAQIINGGSGVQRNIDVLAQGF